MDRMLGIIQLSITKFTRCQSGEARERDMAHYKSKKSSPRHEAQISQFPWMKEQSQLAQRREKAATTHLDNVNVELAIAKMKIEELERDKDQDKVAYLENTNADLASQIRSLEAKLKMKDDYIKSLNVNETREFNDVVSREGNEMTRMNQKAAHLERMIMIWLTHPMLTLA